LRRAAAYDKIHPCLAEKNINRINRTIPRDSRERFYLLPGQGGRNYFQKQKKIMCWTVAVSLVFGSLLTAVMWWMSRPRP
jgi:hypothetical protein